MNDDMKGPIIFIWIMAIAMMMQLCTVVSKAEAGVLSGARCHERNERTTRDNYQLVLRYVIMNIYSETPEELRKYIQKRYEKLTLEYLTGFHQCEKIRLSTYK